MSSIAIESTFVIVGGGIAGVTCAENLAFLCPNEKILLITESSLIKTITNLVPLAKSLTKFDVEECSIDSLTNKKITVIIDKLKSINSNKKEILTLGEKLIKYQYLCLCTGARPKLIECNNNEYVIGIRDTETVLEFEKRIKNSRKLVLVGNGGIASEIAYEVKNINVDWIVKDNYISSTFVDPGAAQFFQNRLKSKETKDDTDVKKSSAIKRLQYDDEYALKNKQGAALGPDWHRKIDISGNCKNLSESVHIHYNCEIKQIEVQSNKSEENKFPVKVTLTNDTEIYCDFVVSATGVNPHINYTTDIEFKKGPDDGIFVNEFMETSLPDIYAAGDLCYAGWEHSKHWFQMRLWTQARQMGSMAGRSMAAKFSNDQIYQDFCFELFGHVTTLFGYQVVLLGKYNGQGMNRDYEALLRITPDKEYIKFVVQNGRLRGAILIGDTGLEETCENLILNETDITPYGDDILNPNIDIEDYFD